MISVLAASCGLLPQPDKFKLDKTSSAPIEGVILSDIDLVDVTRDNELSILDGGIVSIKRPNITLSQIDFVTYLRDGDGLRFYTRTDNKKYRKEQGIMFEWTKSGSAVYQNGVKLASADSIKAAENHPSKIILLQDGDYFQITVDCDTVIKARTRLPGSEFLIIESVNSSSLISAINIDNIFGLTRDIILDTEIDNSVERKERVIDPGNNPR